MYDHEGRRRAVAGRVYRNERDREAMNWRERKLLESAAGEGRVTERDGRKGWGDGVAGMDHLAAPQSSNEI